MKMTPSRLLNIMLLTILSASFFLVNTTANTSNCETTSVEYNPWRDLNDDGIINIYDVVMVTGIYGSTGVPINKTALLYEVNNTFTKLLSRIDDLETQIAELETKFAILNVTYTEKIENLTTLITEMNMTITNLGTNFDILNATKLGKPDYDTFEVYGDWLSISQGESIVLPHNLGTTNVAVYLVGFGVNGIHQKEYGGMLSASSRYGAYWYDLTALGIKVYRNLQDNEWSYIRVMMWKIPES